MIKLQFAADYLKHRFTAKTRHGVHSPFAYRLVDEVIYDFRAKPEYAVIEDIRMGLLNDDRTITVTDLGAGSHINNQKLRRVRAIAKNALKPPRLSQLIYRLVMDLKPSNILELGSCLGITTSYLARAAPAANIITVEGCAQTAEIANESLQKASADNVVLKVGNFDDLLPQIAAEVEALDFVFIDGNHTKEATLEYFKTSLPKLHDNSMMIFDDIYWSRGMKEAWTEIKAHPRVSVTIDLFWIGLVFVRKGQAKEHFKIKY